MAIHAKVFRYAARTSPDSRRPLRETYLSAPVDERHHFQPSNSRETFTKKASLYLTEHCFIVRTNQRDISHGVQLIRHLVLLHQ